MAKELDPKTKKKVDSLKTFAANPELAKHNELQSISESLESLAEATSKIGMFKGDKGDKPVKGEDYFTPEEITAITKDATPVKRQDYFTDEEVDQFRKEVTPVKGLDYDDGQDFKYENFTPEQLEALKVKGEPGDPGESIKGDDGYTPLKGVDYDDGKDGSPDTGEQIVGKINSLDSKAPKIDVIHIMGIKEMEANIHQKIDTIPRGKPFVGGISLDTFVNGVEIGKGSAINFVAGSNTTITGSNTDGHQTTINIASSGSGGNGLTVGTTTITGATDTYLLYNNAGVLGQINPATYQGALTLTTTGTSGAATLTGNTLNIPQYSGGGTNYWTLSGSQLYNNSGTTVGINTTNPQNTMHLTDTSVNAALRVDGKVAGAVFFFNSQTGSGQDRATFGTNAYYDGTAFSFVNTAIPSWLMQLRSFEDDAAIVRAPSGGSSTFVNMLQVKNNGGFGQVGIGGVTLVSTDALSMQGTESTGAGLNFTLLNTSTATNSFAIYRMFAGDSSHGGQFFGSRTAIPAFGIANGVSFRAQAGQDMGFTAAPAYGSLTSVSLFIQGSTGFIGMNTMTPDSFLNLVATLPTSVSGGINYGAHINITPQATSSAPPLGLGIDLNAGYTGGAGSYGFGATNASVSTANNPWVITSSNKGDLGGYGFYTGSGVSNVGVGGYFGAYHGGNTAGSLIGVMGQANYTANTSAGYQIGVVGIALGAVIQVAGYFGLVNSAPTLANAALIADSGSVSAPIFLGNSGGSTKFTLDVNGKFTNYAGSAPTDGQILIGGTSAGNFTAATLTPGTGITITNANNAITISASGGGSSFTWNSVTGTTATIAAANGYITNNASQVVATLPATAAVGDEFRVTGKGAGGWKIAQNASQVIHFGNTNTTTGTGGSLASTNTYDSVHVVCITANTDFVVLSSIGNITLV